MASGEGGHDLRRVIICDLDGTISDCSARQHLAAQKDWDGFHELISEDTVVPHVKEVLDVLIGDRWPLVFLTGRPEEFRTETEDWIERVLGYSIGLECTDVIMRPKHEYGPDVIIKRMMLYSQLSDPDTPLARVLSEQMGAAIEGQDKWEEWAALNSQSIAEHLLFLDDRDGVVMMWRDEGFDCWQVNMGAF